MEKALGVIYQNMQWIFSGIGVTLVGLFLGKKAASVSANIIVSHLAQKFIDIYRSLNES